MILNFRGTIYENGYGLVAKKVMTDPSVSIGAKALYAYIISFAGTTETAWPGRAKICNDLGLSKERFSKCLKELVSAGFILAERERGEKGRLGGYIYTVVVVEKNVDKSTSSPCLGNPDLVHPDLVHPGLEKPNNNNNNRICKINSIKNNNNNNNRHPDEIPVPVEEDEAVVVGLANNETKERIREEKDMANRYPDGMPDVGGSVGFSLDNKTKMPRSSKTKALSALNDTTKAEIERVRGVFKARGIPVAVNGSSVEALVEWTKYTDEELNSVIERIQELAEAGEVDNPAGFLIAGPNIVGDVLKGRPVVMKTKSRARISIEDWGTGW